MRTLLIILLIIVIWRTLVRYVFPVILMNFIQNQQRNFNPSGSPRQNPEGTVNIHKPKDNNNKSDLGGEYVDYEEIK